MLFIIRVLFGRWFRVVVVVRGLRFAHPRLSPFGLRLRGHVLDGRPFAMGATYMIVSPLCLMVRRSRPLRYDT